MTKIGTATKMTTMPTLRSFRHNLKPKCTPKCPNGAALQTSLPQLHPLHSPTNVLTLSTRTKPTYIARTLTVDLKLDTTQPTALHTLEPNKGNTRTGGEDPGTSISQPLNGRKRTMSHPKPTPCMHAFFHPQCTNLLPQTAA